MGVKSVVHHSPWIAVAVLGLAFNWFWWMDAWLRPAVVPDHSKTVTLNINYDEQNVFRRGEPVLIRGYGTVNRSCKREYVRNLEFPNGNREQLVSGHGVNFVSGSEGYVTIRVETFHNWPPGEYEFRSIGYHDCNPPFPEQDIPGIRASFILE